MKISDLIEKLQKLQARHGDIEVMFQDPDCHGPYLVQGADYCVAEDGEFPEDWNMPEGFEYVEIRD